MKNTREIGVERESERERGREWKIICGYWGRAEVRGEKPILLGTFWKKAAKLGKMRKIGGRCKRLYPEREFDSLRTISQGQRRWVFFSLRFCVLNAKVVSSENERIYTWQCCKREDYKKERVGSCWQKQHPDLRHLTKLALPAKGQNVTHCYLIQSDTFNTKIIVLEEKPPQ